MLQRKACRHTQAFQVACQQARQCGLMLAVAPQKARRQGSSGAAHAAATTGGDVRRSTCVGICFHAFCALADMYLLALSNHVLSSGKWQRGRLQLTPMMQVECRIALVTVLITLLPRRASKLHLAVSSGFAWMQAPRMCAQSYAYSSLVAWRLSLPVMVPLGCCQVWRHPTTQLPRHGGRAPAYPRPHQQLHHQRPEYSGHW
jgi:hypothetical protein